MNYFRKATLWRICQLFAVVYKLSETHSSIHCKWADARSECKTEWWGCIVLLMRGGIFKNAKEEYNSFERRFSDLLVKKEQPCFSQNVKHSYFLLTWEAERFQQRQDQTKFVSQHSLTRPQNCLHCLYRCKWDHAVSWNFTSTTIILMYNEHPRIRSVKEIIWFPCPLWLKEQCYVKPFPM